MLGRTIHALRTQRALSLEELAARAGIPTEVLRNIEEGIVRPPLDGTILLRMADQFKFRQSVEYVSFLKLNRAPKFKAYVVGLPKTGTVSLTGIFGRYWVEHEFNQWNTHLMVHDYDDNLISDEVYRNFVLGRDASSGFLELDSAHYNRHYMDILADANWEAKFILLIRDCFSWVNSFINYFTEPDKEAVHSSPTRNGLPFDLPRSGLEAKRELIENFGRYIDAPLSFWARENRRMIDACRRLPPERYLIIRTSDINGSIDKMAHLVGISPDTLIQDHSHLNKASYHVNILRNLGQRFLEEKFSFHCSSLMDEFFPGYAIKDFLNR